MKSISYTYRDTDKRFSLADTVIDSIICEQEIVRFGFSNGFYITEHHQPSFAQSGFIEFHHGGANEFNCYILKRKISKNGAKLYGKPVALTELADIITRNGRTIELFKEFYDSNNLFWQGNILPYRANGLSDHVIIETSGYSPMILRWE